MIITRRTLTTTCAVEGRGLHSGVPVRMKIHPGEAGIAFRIGTDRILANPDSVTDTQRCTRLGPVATVEHVMSALAGLEITDAEIEIDAPECPGGDGSAHVFVQMLLAAGTTDLPAREGPDVFDRVFAQNEHGSIGVSAGTGRWRYEFQSDTHWPFRETYETSAIQADYASEISPARTTAFESELPWIRQMGLGQGLSEDSVLILGQSAYVNTPRFPDELSRHKLLDAAGDLYLTGVPLRYLNVVGQRSGHTLNVEAARRLWARLRQ